MGKERLKDIAYNVGISADGEKALMSSDDYDFLYNYALEQAERVQELEDIIYKDERQAVLESMYEQNKRYREALEFYADEENWIAALTSVGDFPCEVEEDRGEKARKALESDNE
mgnify:CR=1 FL=1